MKRILVALAFSTLTFTLTAQISARLMRYLDVSESHIAFVYGGDVWVVPKTGGTAYKLTESPGEESWPRFSPDGSEIAFTASYDGNEDVYVMPTGGGVPTRVTYASFADRMLDWHPNGERILFASRREQGDRRTRQLFLIPKSGGMPERLPLPYGELAAFSPDGNHLAYITKITENFPFKRYRGGLTSDILVYDLNEKTVERLTDHPGTEGKPAWSGEKIYFLSDQDENLRFNLWSYDTGSQSFEQLTEFEDFDITYMAAGPSDVVFEAGGRLYRMDIASGDYQAVSVDIVSDLAAEKPRSVDVSRQIAGTTPSPDGKRVIFEARGELFSVPKEKGYTKNLTRSSGAFDHSPAWSPDGKYLAFWSDQSREYEIHLRNMQPGGETRRLTQRGKGFGYTLYWSPDSEKLAFIDETNTIYVVDVESGETTEAGNTYWNIGHGSRYSYPIAWSPDSKWLAFSKGLDNANEAIFLYDTEGGELHQATSGFYDDASPAFSPDGKYLFFLTDRNFSAAYSDLGDGTWIYPNATQIAALSLTADAPSLLLPKNDSVAIKVAPEEKTDDAESEGKEDGQDEEADKGVAVDFEDLESRLFILPPDAGNLNDLFALEGKLVYRRLPNTGSGERGAKLMLYDLEEREEKEIIGNVSGVAPVADGKQLLVASGGRFGIIQAAPGQKIDTPIATDGLSMDLVPREEWNQIFNDTWRRYRDFFYDPDMHGVDWDAMRTRYGALLDDARTRWDVSFIQSNLQAELSAGHTYTFGGDTENVESRSTGYLGINWEKDENGYRIARIIRPAPWDVEVRSPFDYTGVDVAEGDYILAVNGLPLDLNQDPYAAFEGLAGKTVALTVRSGDDSEERDVIVALLSESQESLLRQLAWLEYNRQMVDELSDGQVGYVYMSNTSSRGQLELVRMYYGQLDKKGFVIDERFNGGGRLADRFLELLTRPVVYNLHWRHGRDHTQPVKTNTGPLAMVINGWAASGGDGLPWAFQELEAGPIIGERTLGILVGPATGHRLVDGGGITVPGARLYDNDGHWFWEGEGVSPDIPVWDDPNLLMQGKDPQLARAVQAVLDQLEEASPAMTPAPTPDDRTAKGLNGN